MRETPKQAAERHERNRPKIEAAIQEQAWQSEAEKALPPRIVHKIGSFNYTVCGRIWTPGTNPADGRYGMISGTRDLAKVYDVLTTCPQCLRVMDEQGDLLTKQQQGILLEST